MSNTLVTAAALIAARAPRYIGGSWHPTQVASFAIWSLSQHGDASIDDVDLKRHLNVYRRHAQDDGVDLAEEVEL